MKIVVIRKILKFSFDSSLLKYTPNISDTTEFMPFMEREFAWIIRVTDNSDTKHSNTLQSEVQ